MEIIFPNTLETWAQDYPYCRGKLTAWAALVEGAAWRAPGDIRATFPAVSLITPAKPGIVPQGLARVIFNIGAYRLVAHVKFRSTQPGWDGCVFLKWFGSHADYDRHDWTKEVLP